MKSFKDFIFERFNPHFNKKTGEARQHRHMANMIPDVNSHSATGGKTVPEYCKHDNNAVQEFEQLKQPGIKGSKPITGLKVQKLAKQFGFNIPSQANEEVKCGNTGISVTIHPTDPKSYLLHKK